jgi:hypothetical protein
MFPFVCTHYSVELSLQLLVKFRNVDRRIFWHNVTQCKPEVSLTTENITEFLLLDMDSVLLLLKYI